MGSGHIRLATGAHLVCDLPMLAVGAQAPAWLGSSGLDLDTQGFAQVNAFQQSTSHAVVFAVGDVASRVMRRMPEAACMRYAPGRRCWPICCQH